MLGGNSGSTRSNERHESVTPCRKITGTPSTAPCSTYSIRTPVESDTNFFTASSAGGNLATSKEQRRDVEGLGGDADLREQSERVRIRMLLDDLAVARPDDRNARHAHTLSRRRDIAQAARVGRLYEPPRGLAPKRESA